jgi:hydrogenase maturation factor
MFKNEETKRLFLRYAIPCGSVLVKRGKITQEKLDELKNSLLEGKKINDNLEEIFTFAMKMLDLTLKEMDKEKIDEEVIHKYFWEKHASAVSERSKTHKDIPVQKCFVLPGKVISKGLVDTPLGKRELDFSFLNNPKIGDYITLHYDYACEMIDEKTADRLWKIFKAQSRND